jgi:hypothetical protein
MEDNLNFFSKWKTSSNKEKLRGKLECGSARVFSSLIHSVAIVPCAVLMKAPLAHTRGASYAHKKKNPKKDPTGGLGVNQMFVLPQILFFICDLKLCAKFRNSRTTPSRRKVCGREKKRKQKIITRIVDTSFRCKA